MAELWLRGWNMKNMSFRIFHENEDYIQVKIFSEKGLGFVMCWECGWGLLMDVLWNHCDSWGLAIVCDPPVIAEPYFFGLPSFLLLERLPYHIDRNKSNFINNSPFTNYRDELLCNGSSSMRWWTLLKGYTLFDELPVCWDVMRQDDHVRGLIPLDSGWAALGWRCNVRLISWTCLTPSRTVLPSRKGSLTLPTPKKLPSSFRHAALTTFSIFPFVKKMTPKKSWWKTEKKRKQNPPAIRLTKALYRGRLPLANVGPDSNFLSNCTCGVFLLRLFEIDED
jgi:hypothetical protein